jgi:hypothetical protein
MSNQPEPILDVEALVPTQSTCEQLADAGFRGNTYFRWGQPGGGATGTPHWIVDHKSEAKETFFCLLPAPTAAELGAMLPDRIALEYHDGRVHPFWLQTEAEGHPKWGAFYVTKESQDMHASFFRHCDLQTGAKTEAKARARLWLRLESEGLLPEEDD